MPRTQIKLNIFSEAIYRKHDPNAMYKRCARVQQLFVHLLHIVNIRVDGSLPSECFELLQPLDTVKSIVLLKFGHYGFPFGQFGSTERVLIRADTPIMAIDSLWTLSAVIALRIEMVSSIGYTVDDKDASNYILNTATNLQEIGLDDCGDLTFAAICTVANKRQVSYAKFTHNAITAHWEKGELKLETSSNLNAWASKYGQLPGNFKRIAVIGSIDVADVSNRYDPNWRMQSRQNALEYTELGWYIFYKSQGVAVEVDLSQMQLNNGSKSDSFWFVHNSISCLSEFLQHHSDTKPILKYLYVTHDTSDLADNDVTNGQLNASMQRVKGVLSRVKSLDYIVVGEMVDGKFEDTEVIKLKWF